MAGGYGQRWRGPLGARDDAMGGAAQNLGIDALLGQGDMVTVFDDFNDVVSLETFGDAAIWETSGWVLTDVGAPVADSISMNSAATATLPYDSCIRINAGTAADTGGNAQLDMVNASLPASGTHPFQHLWIAETGAGATVLDNMDIVFACRVGFITNDTTAGAWDGKAFIGFAEAGDVSILTAATGAITQVETGPLVGFHIQENGVLRGISQRTVNTTYATAVNSFNLYGAGSLNSTLANGVATIGDPVWIDLALRMHITDMSDGANNGTTSFWTRRVPGMSSAPGSEEFTSPFQTVGPFRNNSSGATQQVAVLNNQTPNNDIALVPTIEVANGPTQLSDVLIDWWVFGMSRYSRTRKL